MRPEEAAKIRRELEPPWNDLREQRVLGRIQEARRRGRRPPARILAGAFAVATLACLALWMVRARRDPGEVGTGAEPALTIAGAHEQRMALPDGSQAFLVRDAHIEVQEQRPEVVRIAQRSGEVRYEVRPDRARAFVVAAAGTTVRVRGTIFTVDVAIDHVEVRVQRGRVEVDDGTRARDLVVGESLRLPAHPTTTEEVPAGGGEGATATGSAPAAGSAPASAPGSAPASAPAVSSSRPSFADLLTRADAARAEGRSGDAARALERLLAAYPQDPRAPHAMFLLGEVERARGRPSASARAFERCLGAAPAGPLAQDALAEAANSWVSAGVVDAARAAARRYLDRWPSGLQATQMRAILTAAKPTASSLER